MKTVFATDNVRISLDGKGFFYVNGHELTTWLVESAQTPVLFEEVLDSDRYTNALWRVLNRKYHLPNQTYGALICRIDDIQQQDQVSEIADAIKHGNIDSTHWTYMLGQAIRNIVAPMREYGSVWHSKYAELDNYEVYRSSQDWFNIGSFSLIEMLMMCKHEPDRKIVKIDKQNTIYGDFNVILKRTCIRHVSYKRTKELMMDHRFRPFDNDAAVINGIKLGFDNWDTINLQNFNWAAKLGQVIRRELERAS